MKFVHLRRTWAAAAAAELVAEKHSHGGKIYDLVPPSRYCTISGFADKDFQNVDRLKPAIK